MSTVPDVLILEVKSPSSLSAAVAPGSVKVSPTVKFIGLAPTIVIVGGVLAGGVAAFTITFLIHLASLPSVSLTVYTIA